MPGHAERERLVDAAIGVCEIDVEVVDGRAEGHAGKPHDSRGANGSEGATCARHRPRED